VGGIVRGGILDLYFAFGCPVTMLNVSALRSSFLVTLEECKGKLGDMKAAQRNLLNTAEFAAAPGLCPKTVRQWVWTRRVPFVRVGRAIRFRAETVTEIIDRGSVAAVEARQ
jgi:hypothetical protein